MELGKGFEALGAVLWATLDHCMADNDVHSAKVVMILSQVMKSVVIDILKICQQFIHIFFRLFSDAEYPPRHPRHP